MSDLSLRELEQFDGDSRGRGSGREQRYCCPLCGVDKPRDAAHRSLCLNADTGAWNCKRCSASGLLTDRRTGRAVRHNPFAIAQPPRARPQTQPRQEPQGDGDLAEVRAYDSLLELNAPDAQPARDFLDRRGIPLAAVIGKARYAAVWRGRKDPRIVFPIYAPSGELIAVQARTVIDPPPFEPTKVLSRGPIGQGVFNPAGIDADPVILTEAPLKALALIACGYPAVALCGTSLSTSWPYLARLHGKRVFVAYDNDAGTEHDRTEAKAVKAGDLLRAAGVAQVKRLRTPAGVKDWDDLLRLHGAIRLPDLAAPPKTAAQEPRTAPAPAPDESEDLPDLLPGEAEILALLDAGLVTQDAAEAVLSDIFAGRPTPEPAQLAPPPSTRWRSAFADRLPDPDAAAVDELRDRIMAALEHSRALRPGETVSDPERYAAREAADALSPYPALAIGARTRLEHLGVSLPAAA